MEASSVVLLVAGLVTLVVGGEVLVRGAGGLARALGMSPLLVGLTVVAFATSAPELAVALDATRAGNPGLAVGNVVGSNIANVLLVLGVSAAILPLAVGWQVLRRDIPLVAAVSAVVLVMALDLRLSRLEGLLLVLVLVAYVVLTVRAARRGGAPGEGAEPPDDPGREPVDEAAGSEAAGPPPRRRMLVDGVLIAIGVAGLVLGANWLVEGSTAIARSFGVSDLIIGLTVVAVGTSLPELATSLIASLRGERDMAVGNVVGSCLFNLGAVLGLSAALSTGGIPIDPAAVRFDLPFMVATAVALVPVAFTGLAIARWEGLVFVGYYGAYLVFLVLSATDHPALPAFSAAMLLFVVPLTLVTFGVLVAHELRARRVVPVTSG